jgi:hypothetical protein
MLSIRDITIPLAGRDSTINVYEAEKNKVKPVFIYIVADESVLTKSVMIENVGHDPVNGLAV